VSKPRDEILFRIRAGLGRAGSDRRMREDIADRLARRPPRHDRPAVPGDLARSFESCLTAVRGGFRRTGADAVMQAIGDCLDEHELPPELMAAPALEALTWPEGWTVSFGPTRGDDRVSVTPCFAAVAETGSVVLVSGRDTPTSLNFLPEVHIVLLNPDQLVANVEDVWPRLRAAGAPPRTVNFITGPSKTADVEQTIEYGAHGPRALEVILINSPIADRADADTPSEVNHDTE